MYEDKVKEFVRFQIHRKVISLFKNFLILVEENASQPYNINDETFKKNRKRILDAGNDVLREIDEILNKVEITLK